MSKLETLKKATSRHDIAHILGFRPKALTYILYKKPETNKYEHFERPKRSGGMRSISAPYPDLKKLQTRLSGLLQDCVNEINKSRGNKSVISHGFRPNYSIITNAAIHRKRHYIFNIDLENFFGTINFGRVRGFFISNRHFKLHPDAATVVAQIACHDNALPQGSPCSPVISNLIGHLLDIRLVAIASQEGCTYTRYADDLTFSTNKRSFPSKIAKIDKGTHQWQVGGKLKRAVEKAGFTINNTKTRMQYKNSRQDVTGLVVNSKVNTRVEYRRTARAMVHRLLKTGRFQIKKYNHDASGKLIVTEVDGTPKQLNGILSFIDSVTVYNMTKDMTLSEKKKSQQPSKNLNCNEKVYKSFLLYNNFYASPMPVIICEGKTDNIYLKAAIKRLAGAHPSLAEKKPDGSIGLKVSFFRRSLTARRILDFSGGSGEFKQFVQTYKKECDYIATSGKKQPVILLIDNDAGAKDILNSVKNITKLETDRKAPFIFVTQNIYIVLTPRAPGDKDTMIEDFFPESLRKTKLKEKSFNPKQKRGVGSKTHYGKYIFAKKIVEKRQKTIDFNGFTPILERIEAVMKDYSKKLS